MKPPKRWKMAVVIWLAIYPLLTVVSLLAGPHIGKIEFIPLRTLVLTVVLVPMMVFVMIPTVQKILKSWLNKD